MTIKAELLARLRVTQTGDNDFGGVFTPEMQALVELADGTGADQCDIAWFDERTVADGANDDIDLAGALTDAFGASVAAAELVALFVRNAPISGAANTTTLTLGGAGSPVEGFLGGTSPTIGPLTPGAGALLFAPGADGLGAVTAGSADELRVANGSGAAATYQIAVLARSA